MNPNKQYGVLWHITERITRGEIKRHQGKPITHYLLAEIYQQLAPTHSAPAAAAAAATAEQQPKSEAPR